jgi:hypothetical protein
LRDVEDKLAVLRTRIGTFKSDPRHSWPPRKSRARPRNWHNPRVSLCANSTQEIVRVRLISCSSKSDSKPFRLSLW